MIGGVVVSFAYVSFAATVPNPKPDTPLTTRQKIAKYIKPRVVDKALDQVRDKVVAVAMYEGAKWIGGPFRGGDEDATREIIGLVIDPRGWGQAPVKIVTTTMKPSQSASPVDDTPGADPATQSSRLPVQERAAQGAPQNSPTKQNDPSSHNSQPPDTEFVTVTSQAHSSGEPSASAKTEANHVENAAPPAAPAPAATPSQDHAIPLEAGKVLLEQLSADGPTFNPNPEVHSAESAPAQAAPAAAPAAQPTPAREPDRGAPGGRSDPMGGAHEIGGGHDKPDHNTPGGRDVSNIG
jgi:hypothetical protein